MVLDPQKILDWPFEPVEQAYTERDTILYALGCGLGFDPLDEAQLRFVFEEPELLALPSMAAVLSPPGFWARHPDTGIDWVRILHGEQAMEIHKPLPAAARVVATTKVTDIVDKGPGKGALLFVERTVRDADSGRRPGDAALHDLRARRRRLRRHDGDGAAAPSGPGPRAGPGLRPADRAQQRPDLPPVRRSQPVACQPAGRARRRLRAADPARPVQLGRRRPRHSENPAATTTRRACARWRCVSRRRSIRARRSAPRCGATGPSSPSAPGSRNGTRWC